MKKLYRYKFYIVNSTKVNSVFAYRKSFLTRGSAQEAIDAYLAPELVLSIMSGTEIHLHKIPRRRTPFRVLKPKEIRRANVGDRVNNYRKRERIKSKGVVAHSFKRVWEPMPTDAKQRKALQVKDRDRIRNHILN